MSDEAASVTGADLYRSSGSASCLSGAEADESARRQGLVHHRNSLKKLPLAPLPSPHVSFKRKLQALPPPLPSPGRSRHSDSGDGPPISGGRTDTPGRLRIRPLPSQVEAAGSDAKSGLPHSKDGDVRANEGGGVIGAGRAASINSDPVAKTGNGHGAAHWLTAPGAPSRFQFILEERRRRKKAKAQTQLDLLDAALSGQPFEEDTPPSGSSTPPSARVRHGRWPSVHDYEALSLGVFTLRNPLRKFCIACIEWPWWDKGVLLLIVVNTIQLMMFDPFDTSANIEPAQVFTRKAWPPLGRDLLAQIGLVLSALFVLEALIKILALGFVRGSKTYLAQRSNWLDFFVVLIGCIDFAGDEVDIGAASSLRLLRILRVLRAAMRSQKLRNLVQTIMRSIPLLTSTLVTLCLILLIFGILGVQLYQGALQGRCFHVDSGKLIDAEGFCDDGFVESALDEFWIAKGMQMTDGGIWRCQKGKSACLRLGENPGRGAIHFDNILNGIVTIFQIMTLEGWADLCYQLQDSNSFWNVLYFLLLVWLGPFFAVQLFLVVLAEAFEKNKDDEGEAADAQAATGKEEDSNAASLRFLQDNRQQAADRRAKGVHLNTHKPPPPHGLERFRTQLRHLALNERFNNVILGFILMNTLSMATEGVCEFEREAWCLDFKIVVEIFNVSFTFVFAFEAAVKLFGLGPTVYLHSTLNVFDFVIVVASLYELHGTFNTLECYMAPLQDDWDFKSSRLDTMVSDAYLTPEVIKDLTVPKAIKTADGTLHINPMHYHSCGSGGFFSVMRAFRLVRLIKFLRGFPEIHKQVKILLDVLKLVMPLFVLIGILLLIFTVLGMNLLGGELRAEWDEEALTKGAEIFLRVPDDENGGKDRHGRIQLVDPESHPLAPYQVEIDFGLAFAQTLNNSVGGRLDHTGMLWASTEELAQGLPDNNTHVLITGIVPRFNFDNLAQAFVTCFQVMTMANWNDNLYDAWPNGATSFIFFALVIVLGNWMLFNLFVAILLGEFFKQKKGLMSTDELREEVMLQLGSLSAEELTDACEDLFVLMDDNSSGGVDVYELEDGLKRFWKIEFSSEMLVSSFEETDTDGSGFISIDEFKTLVHKLLASSEKSMDSDEGNGTELLHAAAKTIAQADISNDASPIIRRQRPDVRNINGLEVAERSCMCGLSLSNPIRKFAIALISTRWFDHIVTACILISTTALAIDNNFIGNGSTLDSLLSTTDILINIVFVLELIFKILALSFREYVKSSWHKMDIFIVFTSVLDFTLSKILSPDSVSFLKLFRVLRSLRPLKLVGKYMTGLDVLVRTAANSFDPLCNTMFIVMAFGLLLGLFMMQLMAGVMNACSDPTVWTRMQCQGLSDDGVQREWQRYYINFDNLGQALFAQLVIATQDDWPAHMLAGTDVSGKFTGPMNNLNLSYALFYIISITGMAFVVINMVVGVFVDAYYDALDWKMEENEKNQVKLKPLALTQEDLKPVYQDPPAGSFREKLLMVVNRKEFDGIIAVFICSNILAMTFESYKRTSWQAQFDEVSNAFFALVFGGECIAKMAALRPRRYLDDNFNKFDFFLVMVTFLGYVVESLQKFIDVDPKTLRMLRMLRILRILRALRLVRAFKGLQKIVQTLIRSGSACGNLMAMLVLVFFIFAVILVSFFGSMCVAGDEAQPGLRGVTCLFTPEDKLLDRHAHFQGVGIAMYTLFRVATGDAWGDVMDAATLEPPRHVWDFVHRSREPISDEAWKKYTELIGPGNRTQESVKAVDIAVEALRKWYQIVQGREDEAGWPMPNGEGAEMIALARLVLPNCLTGQEADTLREQQVANCDVAGTYHSSGPLSCSGTCGLSPVYVYIFFYLFFCVSAFVLLQLVIGVLMDIYLKVQTDLCMPMVCPGCDALTIPVLKRITRRWLLNARAKSSSTASDTQTGALHKEQGRNVHQAVTSRMPSLRRLSTGRVAPAIELAGSADVS